MADNLDGRALEADQILAYCSTFVVISCKSVNHAELSEGLVNTWHCSACVKQLLKAANYTDHREPCVVLRGGRKGAWKEKEH